MTESENAAPARKDEPSLIVLALRVLRGELTETQALEIVESSRAAEEREA